MKRMRMLGTIGALVAAAWVAGAMAGFTGQASAQALLQPVQYVNPGSTLQQIQAAIDNGGTVFFEYGEYNQLKSTSPGTPNTGKSFNSGKYGNEVHIIGLPASDGTRPKINGGSVPFKIGIFSDFPGLPVNFKIENIEISNPDMAGAGLLYSRIGIMVLDALGTQVTINHCKITITGNESDPGHANNYSAAIWFRVLGKSPPPGGARVHITNNEIIGSKINMGIGLGQFWPETPTFTAPRFFVDNNRISVSNLRGSGTDSGAITLHGNLSNAVLTNNTITGDARSPGYNKRSSAIIHVDYPSRPDLYSKKLAVIGNSTSFRDPDSGDLFTFTGDYQLYLGDIVYDSVVVGNRFESGKAAIAQCSISPGSHNNYFGFDSYGSVLPGGAAAAGVVCHGHDNWFEDNHFYGDYPGWRPCADGPGLFWFTDTSYNNRVVATKLNGPPYGHDICCQVLDETDNPKTPKYDGKNEIPGYDKCRNK